jgi:hypothetical protein
MLFNLTTLKDKPSLDQYFPTQGNLVPPLYYLPPLGISGDSLGCYNFGGWERPVMLLNILWCTKKLPQQKNYPAQNASRTEAEKPCWPHLSDKKSKPAVHQRLTPIILTRRWRSGGSRFGS